MQLSAVNFLVMLSKFSAGPFDFARCFGQAWDDVVHAKGVIGPSDIYYQPACAPMCIALDIGNGLDWMRREFVARDDFHIV